MSVDPTVLPGFLLLAAELATLASVGFVVVRVALRQADARMALAQGLVVGPALWGIITSFVLHVIPGMGGAAVGWIIVVAGSAGLAWRGEDSIRPRPRVAVGFTAVALVLLWIALASRQLLGVSDPQIQLGLAAAIRAGAFPPELSWSPGISAPYHFGASLLAGLLTPPVGPDLAFVWEFLGAYTWMSFVLIVVTALLRCGSGFAVLVSAPLLLTASAWTYVNLGDGVLQVPVPAGLPAAGLRASLAGIYWPVADHQSMPDMRYAALPDIWNHSFPMAYALAFVVLQQAARAEGRSWAAVVTRAALVGFAGLLSLTVGPVILLLWAGLEAVSLVQARHSGLALRSVAPMPVFGLALAVCLLALVGAEQAGGFLDRSMPSSLSLAWIPATRPLPQLEALDFRPGGVGVLEAGPIVVAGAAVLFAWRNRLVLALAAGSGLLVLGWLVLQYEPQPWTLDRLTGHARNFALIALLLALTDRLTSLRPRWRYLAGALLVGLVVWPTVIAPVRYLMLAAANGIEISNARPPEGPHPRYGGRFSLRPGPSERVASYIRDQTATEARVLSPYPNRMTYATGRPNASGFVGLLHYISHHGPEYLDALHYLEPAAIRRLGIDYVHAPDAWIQGLPEQARRWLRDPQLFEILIEDDGDSLYRVRPAFSELVATPATSSFEALRQGVIACATVYVPWQFQHLGSLRAIWVLSHARTLGATNQTPLFQRTRWPFEPLGPQTPDLVVLPDSLEPWMFPPAGRQPIWWNGDVAVYAPDGAVGPVMMPPSDTLSPEPPPVSVRVSNVHSSNAHLDFSVTISDHAPDKWTGQDWVLVAGEPSRWAIPTELEADGRTPAVAKWFAGHVAPGRGTTTREYSLNLRTSRLGVREGAKVTSKPASSDGLGQGVWMLALRLHRDVDRGTYIAKEEAAFIPVLQIEIASTGYVSNLVDWNVLDRRLPTATSALPSSSRMYPTTPLSSNK